MKNGSGDEASRPRPRAAAAARRQRAERASRHGVHAMRASATLPRAGGSGLSELLDTVRMLCEQVRQLKCASSHRFRPAVRAPQASTSPPRRTRLALAAAASTSAAAVTAWAYHHLVPSPKCTARRRRATGGRAQLRGTARGALGATRCCCIISSAAAGAADRGSVRPSAGSVRRTCLACPSNCERSTAGR